MVRKDARLSDVRPTEQLEAALGKLRIHLGRDRGARVVELLVAT